MVLNPNNANPAIEGDNSNGTGAGVVGQVSNPANASPAVEGTTTGSGDGVYGSSSGGNGVYGTINADGSGLLGGYKAGVIGDVAHTDGVIGLSQTVNGVFGLSSTVNGVLGQSVGTSGIAGTAGVVGDSNTNAGVIGVSSHAPGVIGHSSGSDGVQGTSSHAGSSGVYGLNNAAGGWGVYAASSSGTALQVDGVASFSRSGAVSIPSGSKTATITVKVSTASLVFANLQNSLPGVFVEAVVPHAAVIGSNFQIVLSEAVPSGKTAKVAWFVVN